MNIKQREIVEKILRQFGGKSYSNGAETVRVFLSNECLNQFDLERCVDNEGDQLYPIASIEDQFDSVFLVSKAGDIYLCFLDGEVLSVEVYADNIRNAICKTLGVNRHLLWMFQQRAKQ